MENNPTFMNFPLFIRASFDCEGFNYTKEAFCALHGKCCEFMEV